MEVFVLWVATNTVIVAFLDLDQVDNLGLLYLFITLPVMIPGSLEIFRQKELYIQTLIMKNIKSEKEADCYLIVLYKLIQERDLPGQRIVLFGMLKNHYSNCIKREAGCVCGDLIGLDHKQEDNHSKLWYTFYKNILEECTRIISSTSLGLDKFSKCARFHILYSYVAHDRLDNRYKALYELMIAEDNKPDLREEMSIFTFKHHIESEMNEFDSSEQYRQLDVNMIVEF